MTCVKGDSEFGNGERKTGFELSDLKKEEEEPDSNVLKKEEEETA